MRRDGIGVGTDSNAMDFHGQMLMAPGRRSNKTLLAIMTLS
jgi:hypothetical protein